MKSVIRRLAGKRGVYFDASRAMVRSIFHGDATIIIGRSKSPRPPKTEGEGRGLDRK